MGVNVPLGSGFGVPVHPVAGHLQQAHHWLAIHQSLEESFTQMAVQRSDLAARKQALEDQNQQEGNLLQAQKAQQVALLAAEQDKQSLIAKTKGQESIYQQLIANQQQTAAQIKAQLIAAQEQQAQEMAVGQSLEAGLEDVRREMSSVRDARMAAEVRRAELRTQLSAVESTLSGTYQLDPVALADGAAPGSEPAADAGTESCRKGRGRLGL